MLFLSCIRRVLVLGVSLFLAAVSTDAATIRGTVTRGGNVPTDEARVVLIELGLDRFVDEDGSYRFDDVPPGDYHLQAISVRYGSAVREITVGEEDLVVDLALDRSAHRERVVVTATRTGRGSGEVVQPVNVMDRTEIAEVGQISLGDTLSGEAGIRSNSFGAGSGRPVIRGQGEGRIRTLENGIGVGDASTTSPDHAVTVEPFAAESIEVLRGPATLLYGPNAVGGVVNVIDRRIPTYVPARTIAGSVGLIGSSVSEQTTGSFELNGGSGALAWHVDGLIRDTDDYDIPGRAVRGDPDSPEGTLPNSFVETETGTFGLSWIGDDFHIGGSVRAMDSFYGIPAELEEDPMMPPMMAEEDGIAIDVKQRRYDLRGGFDLGDDGDSLLRNVTFQLGATDYMHRELEGSEVGTTFFADTLEGRVELTHGSTGPVKGVFGAQFIEREIDAVGAEAFIPPVDTTTYGVFAIEEWSAGPLRYEFGLRFDRQESETPITVSAEPMLCGTPVDRDFDTVSGSIGVVWLTEGGVALGASASRVQRPPTAEELFSCGEHVATQSFEVGDPTLDEETALALDVNFRKRTGRFTGELSLFRYDYSDFIYEFDTGLTEPPVDGLPVFAFGQADAEFTGAEFTGLVELYHDDRHDLDFEYIADTVRAELSDTGTALPRIPPLSVGAGVRYRGAHWHARLHVRRFADQTRRAPSETSTDGYTLISADVGYRASTGQVVHDILVRGTNLTNQEARPHTSRLKDLVPLPGADLSVIYRVIF